MSVVMVFIDGIGLGADDVRTNPFARAPMPTIRSLLDGERLLWRDDMTVGSPAVVTSRAVLVPVDATLGVDGLPQSATGQTALLTGENGSAALGRHVSGVPTPTLVNILRSHSIFKQLRVNGLSGTFANPFTDEYFEAVEAGRLRMSATTTALVSAELSPRMESDYNAGLAVFHDITGAGLVERGHDVDIISPEEAGRRLADVAATHDFTLFEHFMTDMAGHAQDETLALELLATLDAFLGSLLHNVDLDETLVLVISDHGNMEDLSIRTHTVNPVPALLIGAGKDVIARRLHSLLDVTPVLVDHLQRTRGRASGTVKSTKEQILSHGNESMVEPS